MKNLLIFLIVAIFVSSCSSYTDEQTNQYDKKIEAYIQKHQLKMTRSESGLYYHIEKEGEGAPIRNTAILSAKYTGKLLNGKVFDEQKEPIDLQLIQLIHGWREVAYYLKSGGKATIIVPPQLGYGKSSKPSIPSNSVLVFDIEIVAVK